MSYLDKITRSELLAREHACIQLRVPKSGDAELDALIREAVRRELAGKAMEGMLGAGAGSAKDPKGTAEQACIYADALLAALEAGHEL